MNLKTKYPYFIKVAGEEVKTLRYVYHISSKSNTEKIIKKGLITKVGFCYDMFTRSKQVDKKDIPPAVFAFNLSKKKLEVVEFGILGSKVWRIDTKGLTNIWYRDNHFRHGNRIVTFENISPHTLKLIN